MISLTSESALDLLMSRANFTPEIDDLYNYSCSYIFGIISDFFNYSSVYQQTRISVMVFSDPTILVGFEEYNFSNY